MEDYIEEIPGCLIKNIDQYPSTNLNEVLENIALKNNRVIVLATGSSSNAIYAMQHYMQKKLKITIEVIEPFNFVHYKQPIDNNALYIGISQSGKSTSTIDAMKYINESTNNTVIFTSDTNSPITEYCKNVIDIGCGIETVGFVTLGFSSTLLSLALFTIRLKYKVDADKEAEICEIKKLKSIINQIKGATELAEKWYEVNKMEFKDINQLIAIGYGQGYGIAREAETKITETVRCSMNSFELEEYMHGPYLNLNKNTYLLMVEDTSDLSMRSNALSNYMKDYTEHIYSIKTGYSKVEREILCVGEVDDN
ncbi:MAG: SIS domain-containing protein [Bacilli bacterium]